MNGTEERTKHEGAESSTTHVPLNTPQSAISGHIKVIIIGAGKPSSFSRSVFLIRTNNWHLLRLGRSRAGPWIEKGWRTNYVKSASLTILLCFRLESLL